MQPHQQKLQRMIMIYRIYKIRFFIYNYSIHFIHFARTHYSHTLYGLGFFSSFIFLFHHRHRLHSLIAFHCVYLSQNAKINKRREQKSARRRRKNPQYTESIIDLIEPFRIRTYTYAHTNVLTRQLLEKYTCAHVHLYKFSEIK